MSLNTLCHVQNNIKRVFCAVILCLGCFNYSLVAECVSIFFQVSSLTGKVLVNKFVTICNCIIELARLIFVFLQVLYEDSLIFLKDATDKFAFIIFLLRQIYYFLENFVLKIIGGFLQLGEAIWNTLVFFYSSIVLLKNGIQFVGLTIWRFFLNLPEVVVLKINGFFEFLLNTVYECKNSVLKFKNEVFESVAKTYHFLFDFPIDSVYGLIIGTILLIVLCLKFREICIFVIGTFLKLYRQFISIGVCLWSGRFLENKSRRNVEYSFDDNEILCVVCQFNVKEIIIFPCKHLCLCGDCNSRLISTRPICPICRSDITGTLKVYL